jgi:putative transposase
MYLDISASGFYKRRKQDNHKKEEYGYLVELIDKIREDHPRMGLEKIYGKIKPNVFGRDRFVKKFMELGYGVRKARNYRKTTDSSGVKRFENKIDGIELTGINQCFVCDITYFEMNQRFCYLTFIMDLYNREVVGFSVSKTLRTIDTTLPALLMLVKNRGASSLKGAIFHSDGGGQFYADDFLKLSKVKLGLTPSMGKSCYENPHAERLNGVLKNDYIIPYHPVSFENLIRKTKKAVNMYNYGKPHQALGGMTPMAYKSAV